MEYLEMGLEGRMGEKSNERVIKWDGGGEKKGWGREVWKKS